MVSSTVDVRRAADRAVTRTGWLNSRHSFSFNDSYDPTNTPHGLLLVNHDDVVAPAAGFATHGHRDAEIVTWVLNGALTHHDSIGNSDVIHPGLAQRMSAGAGIEHSERNESSREPVHFIQMWVAPDTPGRTPGYQQRDIGAALGGGGLVMVASGKDDAAAITIGNTAATLYAARLQPDSSIELPPAPYLHLFVPLGQASAEGIGVLDTGDAVRFTDSGGERVTATEPAEILVWAMDRRLGQ